MALEAPGFRQAVGPDREPNRILPNRQVLESLIVHSEVPRLVISDRSSVLGPRSSAIGPRSSAIGHRSSVIGHQYPIAAPSLRGSEPPMSTPVVASMRMA